MNRLTLIVIAHVVGGLLLTRLAVFLYSGTWSIEPVTYFGIGLVAGLLTVAASLRHISKDWL